MSEEYVSYPAAVEENLPDEFKTLPANASYKLTKMMSFRQNAMVNTADNSSGELSILQQQDTNLPRIFVGSILTSPIVSVKTTNECTIIFETEGGIYMLERLEPEEDVIE